MKVFSHESVNVALSDREVIINIKDKFLTLAMSEFSILSQTIERVSLLSLTEPPILIESGKAKINPKLF
ncbi:MAG: hypothetical protein JNN15_12675 [Blastocatellia bacterium]|nr:hypothetical protein [Blastocatellia bacterium]